MATVFDGAGQGTGTRGARPGDYEVGQCAETGPGRGCGCTCGAGSGGPPPGAGPTRGRGSVCQENPGQRRDSEGGEDPGRPWRRGSKWGRGSGRGAPLGRGSEGGSADAIALLPAGCGLVGYAASRLVPDPPLSGSPARPKARTRPGLRPVHPRPRGGARGPLGGVPGMRRRRRRAENMLGS